MTTNQGEHEVDEEEIEEEEVEEIVTYSVPVEVTIEDGEVVRVVVLDESIKLDDPDASPEAIKIAETSDWPAWEFGY